MHVISDAETAKVPRLPEIRSSHPLLRLAADAAARAGIRHRRVFYTERDLRKPLAKEPVNPSLRVEVAGPATLDQLYQFLEPPMIVHFDYDREVSTCFVARDGDDIVGFSWLRLKGEMHISVWDRSVHPLRTGVCYTHHSIVPPHLRRKGVFQTLLWSQYRYAIERDFKFVTNLIELDNIPSLKAHSNMGHDFQSVRLFLLPRSRALCIGMRPSW